MMARPHPSSRVFDSAKFKQERENIFVSVGIAGGMQHELRVRIPAECYDYIMNVSQILRKISQEISQEKYRAEEQTRRAAPRWLSAPSRGAGARPLPDSAADNWLHGGSCI